MSDQDSLNNGSLVPTGRDDLVRVASANLLVSRGMADLAKIQELLNVTARTSDQDSPERLKRLYELAKKHAFLKRTRQIRQARMEGKSLPRPNPNSVLDRVKGQDDAEPGRDNGGAS